MDAAQLSLVKQRKMEIIFSKFKPFLLVDTYAKSRPLKTITHDRNPCVDTELSFSNDIKAVTGTALYH